MGLVPAAELSPSSHGDRDGDRDGAGAPGVLVLLGGGTSAPTGTARGGTGAQAAPPGGLEERVSVCSAFFWRVSPPLIARIYSRGRKLSLLEEK